MLCKSLAHLRIYFVAVEEKRKRRSRYKSYFHTAFRVRPEKGRYQPSGRHHGGKTMRTVQVKIKREIFLSVSLLRSADLFTLKSVNN